MNGVGCAAARQLWTRKVQSELVWAWLQVGQDFELRIADWPADGRESVVEPTNSDGAIHWTRQRFANSASQENNLLIDLESVNEVDNAIQSKIV